MAEEEAEREYNTRDETVVLKQRFQALITSLRDSTDSPLDASARFCHEFCQILVEHGGQWKSEEDPLPLLEMYTVAILCFAEATPSLLPECEHVTVVLEKLALSCLDFLLSLLEKVPDALWKEFQSSVKVAHGILEANGNLQLNSLMALANESGVWTNSTLCSLLSNYTTDVEKVHELLVQEGPALLDMRIKHLIKQRCVEKAAVLAKACAEFPEFGGKKNFKQIYLVCLCETMSQQELMQEIKDIDCKDALDMICNLESEENEKGALYLCTAFLKRQLLQGDVYCAWELTLFWSKLLIRLESAQAFLEQCRLLAQLSGSVYHILLLIKVIQAEVHDEGLPVCIEMCIQALKMGVSNSEDCNSTICKTISCLLPLDLEVKRACQLTEFLVKPSVDSYYAVEMLFNEPDQKLEEENLPLPNSLRCDLLLALKTKWPFDPEFWDWKTLKRHCLALMGEDASIVSSMDKLNDSEDNEVLLESDDKDFSGHLDFILGSTSQPRDLEAERKKKREMKRLREQGFVSARFRNWQAYMQYCVLCDKEFLGHRIVKHALKHVQDGIFRCPICAKTFETRAVLEPHVASHVKQSSKERLAALNTKNTNSGSANTLWSSSKPVYIKSSVKDGQMVYTDFGPLNTNSNTTGKVKTKPCSAKRGNPVREIENTEDCSCPVTSCQKVFKYFRNLVAHVKAHKDEEEARNFLELQSQKAICQYCRRQFVNVTHLNDHLQIHSGDRPYVCIQLGCNSSFNSHAELVMHRKVHSEFQAQCTFQDCGRVFNEAYLLYDHEAQHYITFICKSDNCDQVFYSLSQLNAHQKEHTRPENGEGIGDQMEALPQSFLNLEWMSNQEGAVPYVSSPLQTKQTQNSAHDTRELNHSFSFMNEFSAELNQPPVTAPPVAQDCDLIRAPKTACQMQSDVDHLTQFCLKSCFVKLQPIPIKRADSVLLNALKSSEKIGQLILQDKKLFCCTCEQHKTVQKASATVTPDVQNISITNESAQPLASNNLENEEDNLTHVCPFESCTRKYSTLKSLSRHIKHVHIEAFEEWKLSRKYKRIADIASRKSSEPKNCNFQTHKKKIKPSTALTFTGINLDKFPTDPTITDPFPPFNVKFEGAQNETQETNTTLMQSQMAESWTSSSFEGCNSSYSLPNQFPSMIMSDGLQQSYTSFTDLLAERDIDYVPSLSAAGITPTGNTASHSGVLNEASKYVSNSLRVLHSLNSDQACEMSQVEASEELRYMEARQTNNSVPPNVTNVNSVQNSGQNFDPYFSSYSAETCSNSGQPLEKAEKQCTIDQTGLYFSPDVKTQCSLPVCKEEPECFSVSSVDATVKCDQNNDFPSQEMSQVTTEDASPEATDVTCSDDISKLKKIKTSKRTKWPAILKDGKVICCRCYREFSSTKSLGGHLSKRSQCKPVDEIDLTADLPISFLDFLNDPEISTMQSPLHMSNGQDSQSFIPDSDNVLNNNCFEDGPGLNYNIQNGHVSSGDAAETSFTEPQDQTENSSSMPFLNLTAVDLPTITDNDALRNFETQIPSTVPGEDGKILEIERALQRLDLVDGLPQVKIEKPTLQNLNTETTNKRISKTPHKDESHDVEILKPFRCIKADCAYGAMTKEALFKHLTRVHEESEDCINELKKNPEKLSPYACSMCSKTFTRTTGLKIHYKNVHHLSKEEISKIKIGRPGKKSLPSNNFSCVNKGPVSLTYNSSVQAQSMTSPAFTVAATNINNIPAELSKEKRFKQESSLITQSSACVLQNNPESLISEKDIKTLQDPCCTTDNLNVQCFTQDTKPALATELLFSPGRHCDLEPVTKATDHVVEPMMEQNDLTKKTKCKEKTESPKKEKTIHTKLGRKSDFVDTVNDLSLYRPYRCVHEGCVAAFSVQHNLLLHYKAMHDSEVLNQTAGTIIGSPEQDEESVQIHEFNCQMKDCSKVVTKVTSLLKHYLLLHRCTLEKACSLLSGVEVGTFQCDQSKCPAQFTCHLKYIEHIKNDHKAIRLSADGDFERVDLTFACEYEGCDRVYTTKSNLLRHVLKKHQTVKPKQKNPDQGNVSAKAVSGKPNDGKENILINKIKQRKKLIKKKEKKANDHWTSFAKPTLKTKDEASATCTGKFSLEYPCMIKGCDSVSNTERNIVKHYTTHGLTERYINNRRSHFIFSKRNSRLRNKDVNESDGVSAVTSEVTKAGSAENNADKGGTTADKGIANADECITNTEKGDTAADEEVTTEEKGTTVEKNSITTATTVKNEVPNTEKGFTNAENTVVKSQGVLPENKTSPETEKLNRNSVPMPVQVKRKRGRPRKLEKTVKVIPERKSLRNIRPIRSNHVPKVLGTKLKPATHKEQAENGVAQKLFSPLGLKASILKLYEESPSRNTVRSKLARRVLTSMPLKRQLKKHQALGNKIYTKSLFQLIGKRKYVVHFRNPLKLESVKNVKIVMDGSFSNGADLLLKQLQDMRPMVILKKWLCS
ncbi:zinc finger protein 292a [Trichomycterus rosablanca]|uniref:zinc finger protein 292a n=1 Tax=Trichomycterus rosablanca TaxID=2290929 RepID=UPI002F35524D